MLDLDGHIEMTEVLEHIVRERGCAGVETSGSLEAQGLGGGGTSSIGSSKSITV